MPIRFASSLRTNQSIKEKEVARATTSKPFNKEFARTSPEDRSGKKHATEDPPELLLIQEENAELQPELTGPYEENQSTRQKKEDISTN